MGGQVARRSDTWLSRGATRATGALPERMSGPGQPADTSRGFIPPEEESAEAGLARFGAAWGPRDRSEASEIIQ